MSLWIKIAKNEIRLKSNRLRRNRPLYFILIYAIALFWALYFGPLLFDAILPEILKSFSTYYEPILSNLLEYSFMLIFLLYIMYPLFMLYRKSEIGNKDLILASPVKPGDIFLGEFMGQVPFYFLFILGIGPFIISILLQINPEMTILHYLIFYVATFILLLLGLLIGTIIANYLEYKMVSSNKSKEWTNTMLIFLSFIIILFFYFFHFLFNFIREYPEFKIWLIFYPSLWYSNIILFTINPGLISLPFFTILVSIGLAILIPIILIYLSYKKAYIFYQSIPQSGNNTITIERERKVYDILKKMLPKRSERLIISQFKIFLRKKENVTKLVYIIMFTALLGVFIRVSLTGSITEIQEFPLISSIIIQIYYFKYLLVLILAWMGGLIFGILMGIYILINSKELLFLYRKSSRGIKGLIYPVFIEMLIVIFLFDVILMIFFAFLFQLDLITVLFFFLGYLVCCIFFLLQAFGIQFIRPLFNEKGKYVYFNIYLIFCLQIVSLLITLFITIPYFQASIDYSLGLLLILLINFGLSSGIGWGFIAWGIRKLNRIE